MAEPTTSQHAIGRHGVRRRTAFGAVLGTAALAAGLFAATSSASAAETYATATTGAESAAAVEDALAGYGQARAASVASGAKAFAARQRASALEGVLPLQQARGDAAARSLYKAQDRSIATIDLLLSSESLSDFIRQSEYLDHITRANVDQIKRTSELSDLAESAKASAEEQDAQADARLRKADEQLNAAFAVRAQRQHDGIVMAQAQGTALGGAESLRFSDEAEEEDKADSDGKSKGKQSKPRVAATTDIGPIDDGADWYTTESEFVAEWGPRLDAYLEGTALAGNGDNFAKSAWRYCIDPRWSAAISKIESSNGAICIRPYNAWGWGAADSNPYGLASEWSSWEEAIDAHARGLANGYGYTISILGARTYCPPNWQTWYNTTLSEMSRI